jgi:hypothetical protein
MRRSSDPDLQQAIEFLSNPDLAKNLHAPIPGRPDYEYLARLASRLGHDLSPGAVKEAFRLIVRARLIASPKPRSAGADR